MLPDIEEIQTRRKLLNITQKQLALLAGVSQGEIAKIETKRIDPSYSTLKKIVEKIEQLEKSKTTMGRAKNIHNTKIIHVETSDTILKASQLMNKYGYSQLPVYERNIPVGSISEDVINTYISKGEKLSTLSTMEVKDLMTTEFPIISEDSSLEQVTFLLRHSAAVLTTRKGKIVGIITKADLLKLIQKT